MTNGGSYRRFPEARTPVGVAKWGKPGPERWVPGKRRARRGTSRAAVSVALFVLLAPSFSLFFVFVCYDQGGAWPRLCVFPEEVPLLFRVPRRHRHRDVPLCQLVSG